MTDDERPTVPPPSRPRGPKRRTPSAPMAAINPTAYTASEDVEEEASDEPEIHLDRATRDKLLLRTIARVERIDTENEIITTLLKRLHRDYITRDKQLVHDLRNALAPAFSAASLLKALDYGDEVDVEVLKKAGPRTVIEDLYDGLARTLDLLEARAKEIREDDERAEGR